MKKALITGITGQDGSYLSELLLDKGYEVHGIIRRSSSFNTGRIDHIINDEKYVGQFFFHHGDVTDASSLNRILENVEPDEIYNLAAQSHVQVSFEIPDYTAQVDALGTLRFLDAIRETRIETKFYQASTSELFGLETIGLRYFNVFGKNQDPNGAYAAVIPLWVKKLINHESPVINGDGTYSRDFTYIDNVIQANEKAALTPKEELLNNLKLYYSSLRDGKRISIEAPDVVMDVFNVAYGGNTTLIELFDALKINLAKYDVAIANIEPRFGQKRRGDIPHSKASIQKAQSVLGYMPVFDASEGFEQACAWYWDNSRI